MTEDFDIVSLEEIGDYHITNAEQDAQETIRLRLEFMLSAIETKLTEEQAQILELRYFSQPPKKRTQVAKILGRSPSQIARSENIALHTLRNTLRVRAHLPRDNGMATDFKEALAHHFPKARRKPISSDGRFHASLYKRLKNQEKAEVPAPSHAETHEETREEKLARLRIERVKAYNDSNGETQPPGTFGTLRR